MTLTYRGQNARFVILGRISLNNIDNHFQIFSVDSWWRGLSGTWSQILRQTYAYGATAAAITAKVDLEHNFVNKRRRTMILVSITMF